MIAQIWSHIRPLTAQQRFLYVLAGLFAASTLIHGVIAVVSLIAGDPWSGPVSWRKPVVFSASFALMMVATAWILRLLPQKRWGWIPTVMLGAFSVIEVAVIVLQQWRGEPSHFNNHSAVDDALFGVMGTSVGMIMLALVTFLVWAAVRFRGNGAERVAVLVGLVGIMAAGYVGGSMIAEGDAVLAATGDVPYEVVFGAAGSAKLAHFVGLHGLQFLALIAILAPAQHRLRLVVLGAVGYVALFASVTVTAYSGLPWISPPLPLALIAIAGFGAAAAATLATVTLPRERALVG
jgi:hypothetical protein